MADIQAESIVFPLMSAKLSSKYGYRTHPVHKVRRHHKGIDLAVPSETQVRTISAGRVLFAGFYAGYGNLVTIEHKGSYVTLYGHLNSLLVKTGDEVSMGEIIATVGKTGTATGPQLHFELRKDGENLDPLKFFPSFTAKAEG